MSVAIRSGRNPVAALNPTPEHVDLPRRLSVDAVAARTGSGDVTVPGEAQDVSLSAVAKLRQRADDAVDSGIQRLVERAAEEVIERANKGVSTNIGDHGTAGLRLSLDAHSSNSDFANATQNRQAGLARLMAANSGRDAAYIATKGIATIGGQGNWDLGNGGIGAKAGSLLSYELHRPVLVPEGRDLAPHDLIQEGFHVPLHIAGWLEAPQGTGARIVAQAEIGANGQATWSNGAITAGVGGSVDKVKDLAVTMEKLDQSKMYIQVSNLDELTIGLNANARVGIPELGELLGRVPLDEINAVAHKAANFDLAEFVLEKTKFDDIVGKINAKLDQADIGSLLEERFVGPAEARLRELQVSLNLGDKLGDLIQIDTLRARVETVLSKANLGDLIMQAAQDLSAAELEKLETSGDKVDDLLARVLGDRVVPRLMQELGALIGEHNYGDRLQAYLESKGLFSEIEKLQEALPQLNVGDKVWEMLKVDELFADARGALEHLEFGQLIKDEIKIDTWRDNVVTALEPYDQKLGFVRKGGAAVERVTSALQAVRDNPAFEASLSWRRHSSDLRRTGFVIDLASKDGQKVFQQVLHRLKVKDAMKVARRSDNVQTTRFEDHTVTSEFNAKLAGFGLQKGLLFKALHTRRTATFVDTVGHTFELQGRERTFGRNIPGFSEKSGTYQAITVRDDAGGEAQNYFRIDFEINDKHTTDKEQARTLALASLLGIEHDGSIDMPGMGLRGLFSKKDDSRTSADVYLTGAGLTKIGKAGSDERLKQYVTAMELLYPAKLGPRRGAPAITDAPNPDFVKMRGLADRYRDLFDNQNKKITDREIQAVFREYKTMTGGRRLLDDAEFLVRAGKFDDNAATLEGIDEKASGKAFAEFFDQLGKDNKTGFSAAIAALTMIAGHDEVLVDRFQYEHQGGSLVAESEGKLEPPTLDAIVTDNRLLH